MFLFLHAELFWCRGPCQDSTSNLILTGAFASHHVLSPVSDISGEGSLLLGSKLWSGSLRLLRTLLQKRHQARLLLHPRGQVLGSQLHEMPLCGVR